MHKQEMCIHKTVYEADFDMHPLQLIWFEATACKLCFFNPPTKWNLQQKAKLLVWFKWSVKCHAFTSIKHNKNLMHEQEMHILKNVYEARFDMHRL